MVSLVWPVNTCTSTFMAGVPKGVTIDRVAGTWSFQGQTYQIGGPGNYIFPWTEYPIGVYDMTKIKHLIQLYKDIIWVERRNGPVGD